jgi:transcription initiation factor IIE alpha subunit
MPTDEELFSRLSSLILEATERYNAGECLEDDLPTAADMARKLNYRLETVKKKLRILKEQGLIQSVSVTPRRYRFNYWALKSLDPAHLLYALFCEPESPYFISHH